MLNPVLSSEKVLGWVLSAFGASILFVVGGYITHVNTALGANEKKIADATVELLHTEEEIAILDTKLNMIMRAEHIEYNGPQFKSYKERHPDEPLEHLPR